MSELQDRNRAVWSAGDWDAVAEKIKAVGPRLLDRVGIEPGMRVLDVGTGSGSNVAIPAAQRGAEVVGVDLTDAWFDAGRRRAADAGVEIEWVVGDAEALPFADASFDRVLSTSATCSRRTIARRPRSSCGSASRAAPSASRPGR